MKSRAYLYTKKVIKDANTIVKDFGLEELEDYTVKRLFIAFLYSDTCLGYIRQELTSGYGVRFLDWLEKCEACELEKCFNSFEIMELLLCEAESQRHS